MPAMSEGLLWFNPDSYTRLLLKAIKRRFQNEKYIKHTEAKKRCEIT